MHNILIIAYLASLAALAIVIVRGFQQSAHVMRRARRIRIIKRANFTRGA